MSLCFVTLWFIQAVVVLLTHECSCDCLSNVRFQKTYCCPDTGGTSSCSLYQPTTITTITTKTSTTTAQAGTKYKRIINDTNGDLNKIINNDKKHNLTAVEGLVDTISNSSKALTKALIEEKDPEYKQQLVKALQNVVLTLAENVFRTDETFSNADPEKKNTLASKVFDTFEVNGPLMAATLQRGTTSRQKRGNCEMLLRNVDLNLLDASEVFLFNSDGFSFDRESLTEVSDSDTLGICSVIFNSASTFLVTPASQTLKQSDSFGTNQRFNTLVMMISANTKTPIKRLSKNVTITMKMQAPGLSSPVCYSMQPKTSELTPTGCTAQSINSTHAVCSCNHLTSFVILMSITKSAEESSLALDIISYVSCSLSVLFLLISFVTFVSFASLRSDRNTIHSQLAVCLGLGQLLFLVGIGRTQSKMACAVIAGALHYLFLASFCWMAMEGLQIYLKLVLVFEPSYSLIPVYFCVGYGVPAIIVAAAAGTFPQGYGTETNCWLSKERGFHWSFIGPVFCVVAFNTVMLFIALTVMCRHLKSPARRELPMTQKLQTSVKGAATLFCIMGITWVFGSLNTGGNAQVAFAYIFVLLNGTQGVFIYFFHCVSNDKVKKEYRRVLRKANWMPDCCRQCLFEVFASKSSHNVGQSTGSTAAKGTLTQLQTQREQKDRDSSSMGAFPSMNSATAGTKLDTQKKKRGSVVRTAVKPNKEGGVTTTIVSIPDVTPDDILASAGIYLGETDGKSRGGDGNKPPDTEANKPPDTEANKPPDTEASKPPDTEANKPPETDVGTRADSHSKQTTENSDSTETHGNSLFTLFFNKSEESANEEDSPRET